MQPRKFNRRHFVIKGYNEEEAKFFKENKIYLFLTQTALSSTMITEYELESTCMGAEGGVKMEKNCHILCKWPVHACQTLLLIQY